MIRRRSFLAGAAVLGVASFGSGAAALLAACARADPLERALRELLPDGEAAKAVGADVLDLDPQARDPGVLVERLGRGRGAELRDLARADPGGLSRTLREQHRVDFAEDRVVAVRGWILSETEAWLYALAALPD